MLDTKSKSISWKYFMFHEMTLKLYFMKCSEKEKFHGVSFPLEVSFQSLEKEHRFF